MTFSLTDVSVGSTYMKGKTTMGYDAVGRVVAVLPGIGFRVRDCDGRGVMLWRDYRLVDEEAYDLADETVDDSRGLPGFPDCAFWESQGILPMFVAAWCHYHPDPMSAAGPASPPGFLTPILSAYRDEAEAKGGAFLRAWSRQATEALGYVLTRSDAPPLTLRDFPRVSKTKEQVVATLVPAPGTMYETPKRSRIEPTVPDAPARPSVPPADHDDEEDEDQIEYVEEEPEPEIFNVLSSSNFVFVVVILAWVMLAISRSLGL